MVLSYLPCSSSSLAVFKQKSKDISWCWNSATAKKSTMLLRLFNQLQTHDSSMYGLTNSLRGKKKNHVVLKPRKNKTRQLCSDFPLCLTIKVTLQNVTALVFQPCSPSANTGCYGPNAKSELWHLACENSSRTHNKEMLVFPFSIRSLRLSSRTWKSITFPWHLHRTVLPELMSSSDAPLLRRILTFRKNPAGCKFSCIGKNNPSLGYSTLCRNLGQNNNGNKQK